MCDLGRLDWFVVSSWMGELESNPSSFHLPLAAAWIQQDRQTVSRSVNSTAIPSSTSSIQRNARFARADGDNMWWALNYHHEVGWFIGGRWFRACQIKFVCLFGHID